MSRKELNKMSLDNGVTLAYRLSHPIDNSLTTIVMHHPFLMNSRFYDHQLKDSRFSAYNLISVEAHGHGETTGRGKDFNLWDTASDTLQLLTKLGINQFYVLGTTQGACISLRMALLEPLRIKGLILLAAYVYSTPEPMKIFARKGRDKWCETEIPSDEAIAIRAGAFGGPTRVDVKVFAKLKEMWIKRYAGPEGYDPAVNCLMNLDSIEDKLDQINIPALVLHGSDDKIFPPQDPKEWTKKLPKLWKFEIIERGVHHLPLTEPGDEVIARLVPQFIEATS